MKYICSILILLVLISVSYARDGKCYGLALEGGGDKGAYQVGALAQIVENTDPSEVQYDVVSGVSIGSINGALLAGYPKGQERNATDYMIKTWGELTKTDIYKDWSWGGPVRGLLFKKGLFDSSPFREYIKGQLSPPQRGFYVSATDARTGAEKVWNDSEDWQTLLKAIDASSSFPGFFEPVTDLDNTTYYDGGTSYPVNIWDAINRCIDMGYSHSQIVIDVILCSGATFKDKDVSKYTSIPMTLRFMEIERFYDTMEILERTVTDFYDVNFRYVIAPTTKIESGVIPMVFDHKQIEQMIEYGRRDAKQAMEFGHGVSAKHLLEYTKKKIYTEYNEEYSDFLAAKATH